MRFKSLIAPLKNQYIFLRHGETDANQQKIYMGRQDYCLNEIGLKQASQVMLPFTPDHVFVSPLSRTKETAKTVLANFEKTIIQEDTRLIEKSGGEIEGMTYDEIATSHPEIWGVWNDNTLEQIVKMKFPNGESDEEVANRLENFFTDIEEKHQNKKILIITHSGVIQACRYLMGKTKDEIYLSSIKNCHLEIIGDLS